MCNRATDAKKELWDRVAENTSQGLACKDPLWDETVLLKIDGGLKWILYRSVKTGLGPRRQNTSQGLFLKNFLLDETVLFATGIGLKRTIQGSNKNSFGTDRPKIRPKGFP